MKKSLSGIELRIILKELDFLLDARADKVYLPEKKSLLIQFHVPGKGKSLLKFIPGFLYLTKKKESMPEKPFNFCALLRKRLDGARLRSIEQSGSERVITLMFDGKQGVYRLVLELFGTGNIILCDEKGMIIAATESQEWKDRSIKPKEKYLLPPSEFNMFEIGFEEFKGLFGSNNASKTLAIQLGLGGIYADEICAIAKVDVNKIIPYLLKPIKNYK